MNKTNPSIIIVGAGMTGIQLAIKLKAKGFNNIIMLEKSDKVGGTWNHNTYPGIACDVPSHAYTYSFNPNPNWSNHFPKGDEIQKYFTDTVTKYGLHQHIHTGETLLESIFDEEYQQWRVKTDKYDYVCDLLFFATGILHQPNIPQFEGMENFSGTMFHTSQWDHDIDFSNKKVGVVGVGSSAAQCIPELAKDQTTQLKVFQRTPQWIVEVPDKVFTVDEKHRFKTQPWRMKFVREMALLSYRQNTAALTNTDWFSRLKHKIMWFLATKNLNDSVKDPTLRARLTPDYKFGCKRVIINSTFYDAVQKPNVELFTGPIDKFNKDGIVTEQAGFVDLDVIVLATGFDPAAFMRPSTLIGRDGISIDDVWDEKIQAYRSMFVPGFPNCFIMLGPNSPIGNYSVIEMSEKQTDYALQLVEKWMNDEVQTIEAKPEAMAEWNAMLREKMKDTVWVSGCQSWYLDKDGDPLAWPDSWGSWVDAMRAPNMDHFINN